MHGRKRPYTTAGIKRLSCIVCGDPAYATWQICADNRIHRPVCRACDVSLNLLVLQWAGFPDWEQKIEKYKREVEGAT